MPHYISFVRRDVMTATFPCLVYALNRLDTVAYFRFFGSTLRQSRWECQSERQIFFAGQQLTVEWKAYGSSSAIRKDKEEFTYTQEPSCVPVLHSYSLQHDLSLKSHHRPLAFLLPAVDNAGNSSEDFHHAVWPFLSVTVCPRAIHADPLSGNLGANCVCR